MKYLVTALISILGLCLQADNTVRVLDTLGNEPLLRRTVIQLAAEQEGVIYKIKNAELAAAADELKDGKAGFVVCGSDELAELRKRVRRLRVEPYAVEVLGVAVNAGNEVKDISLRDLRNIFGGNVISWKDYNGTTFMIHKVAPAKNATGHQVFYRKLLQGKPVAKDVALSENAAEPLIMATGNRNALACGVWNLRPMLEARFLTVDGVEATVANVRSGEYPLAITYYLCSIQTAPEKLLAGLRDSKSLEFFNLIPAQ